MHTSNHGVDLLLLLTSLHIFTYSFLRQNCQHHSKTGRKETAGHIMLFGSVAVMQGATHRDRNQKRVMIKGTSELKHSVSQQDNVDNCNQM